MIKIIFHGGFGGSKKLHFIGHQSLAKQNWDRYEVYEIEFYSSCSKDKPQERLITFLLKWTYYLPYNDLHHSYFLKSIEYATFYPNKQAKFRHRTKDTSKLFAGTTVCPTANTLYMNLQYLEVYIGGRWIAPLLR